MTPRIPSAPSPEWLDEDGNDIEDHDRGLVFDLRTLIDRRRALTLFGGLGVAGALAACSTGTPQGGTSTSRTSAATSQAAATSATASEAATSAVTTAADLVEAPDETAGPFPGDGSNGQNVLDDSGIVRRDIRSSFGSSTTTAEGVPLTVKLTVKDLATSAALVGAAVYVWHCDRDGNYSMYSQGVEDENYLRGVQAAGDDGTLSFTTVFPAAYSGRWPHIHFEVYGSVDEATGGGSPVATSQIALPEDVCDTVYATDGYDQSVTNMARTSLDSDNVFGDDGAVDQLATVTGTVADGLVASLTVPV